VSHQTRPEDSTSSTGSYSTISLRTVDVRVSKQLSMRYKVDFGCPRVAMVSMNLENIVS
jgi:hypothetical protein